MSDGEEESGQPKEFSSNVARLNAGILKGLIDARGEVGLIHSTPMLSQTQTGDYSFSIVIASDEQVDSLKNLIRDVSFSGVKLEKSSHAWMYAGTPAFELVGQLDHPQFTQNLMHVAAQIAEIPERSQSLQPPDTNLQRALEQFNREKDTPTGKHVPDVRDRSKDVDPPPR